MKISKKTFFLYIFLILFLTVLKVSNFCSIFEADKYIFENAPLECKIDNTDIDESRECRPSYNGPIPPPYIFVAHWEYFCNDNYNINPCTTINSDYKCDYSHILPNNKIQRVAYGFSLEDTAEKFKESIIYKNEGAGCHQWHYNMWVGPPPGYSDMELEKIFAGCDCSGFVCNIWHVPRKSTKEWGDIAYRIPRWDIKNGDSLLYKGYHVMLYDSGDIENRQVVNVYEAYFGSPEYGVRYKEILLSDKYYSFRKGQDNSNPQITIVQISPEKFSPNNDGYKDETTLEFSVSDEHCGALKEDKLICVIDGNIDLPIKNFSYTKCKVEDSSNGTGIKLPKESNNLYIERSFICEWDGKDNSVNVLPNGRYEIEITAEDLNGNITILDNNYFEINIRDDDNDGLPDDWEIDCFGNLNQRPEDDFDGDGISNEDEFNNKTDPTTPDNTDCGSISVYTKINTAGEIYPDTEYSIELTVKNESDKSINVSVGINSSVSWINFINVPSFPSIPKNSHVSINYSFKVDCQREYDPAKITFTVTPDINCISPVSEEITINVAKESVNYSAPKEILSCPN